MISVRHLLNICHIYLDMYICLDICTATHCNALQRTATHCNALQRTATHSLKDTKAYTTYLTVPCHMCEITLVHNFCVCVRHMRHTNESFHIEEGTVSHVFTHMCKTYEKVKTSYVLHTQMSSHMRK